MGNAKEKAPRARGTLLFALTPAPQCTPLAPKCGGAPPRAPRAAPGALIRPRGSWRAVCAARERGAGPRRGVGKVRGTRTPLPPAPLRYHLGARSRKFAPPAGRPPGGAPGRRWGTPYACATAAGRDEMRLGAALPATGRWAAGSGGARARGVERPPRPARSGRPQGSAPGGASTPHGAGRRRCLQRGGAGGGAARPRARSGEPGGGPAGGPAAPHGPLRALVGCSSQPGARPVPRGPLTRPC
jgi:hypothetical protein